ncbi:MAG: flippase-like domain-containing protein [Bacilli bacterium]|nr:flippase-like domain-containing protein [Bacilli bacterium]
MRKSKKQIAKEQENIKTHEQLMKDAKKKKRLQLISNLIFFLAISILALSLLITLANNSTGEGPSILDTFNNIWAGGGWTYLVPAFGFTLAYFLLWPISLCLYARASELDVPFFDSYCIGASEIFYNGVTPFGAGGQPFQIYSYKSIGVDTSKATGAVLVNYVTYLIATNVFAVLSLIFYPYYVDGLGLIKNAPFDLKWFQWVALVGFILNMFSLVFMIIMGTSRHLRNLLVKAMWGVSKWPLLRRFLPKRVPAFEKYCDDSQIAFKQLWVHRKTFIFSLLIRLVNVACYNAVTYFVIRSCDIHFDDPTLAFWIAFMATSYSTIAVVWLPTPGATGGVEFAMQIVLASIFAGASLKKEGELPEAAAITIVWRVLTYYILMAFSFIVSIIFQLRVNRRISKQIKSIEEIDSHIELPEGVREEKETKTEESK